MSETQASAETQTPPTPTPYQMIGGADVVRRVVDRFYDIMDTAPEAAGIRAMHAADLGPMRERLTEFLSGWLGGPPLYFQRSDRKCIVSAHKPFPIGGTEVDEWMFCMRKAMEDTGVPDDVRTLLDKPFARVCEAFKNR